MNSRNHFVKTIKERKAVSTLAVLFTLTVGILIGTLISRGVRAARQQSQVSDAQQVELPAPVQLSSIFNTISKEIAPAVDKRAHQVGLVGDQSEAVAVNPPHFVLWHPVLGPDYVGVIRRQGEDVVTPD